MRKPDVDLDENLGVQRVAADHGAVREPFGQIACAFRAQLDDLHVEAGMALLELLRQEVADIAAPDDDHPAGFGLLVPEDRHAARHMLGVHGEIDLVSYQHLVVAARHDQTGIPADRQHHDVEIGKQLRELAERSVNDRAAFLAAHGDHPHTPAAERQHVEGARHLKPAFDGAGDLDLGRDDQVDRHVVPAEEIGPGRVQVALVADPRDLFGHVEQRVRDLARHHVDLVGVGNGDDHLGVLGIRVLEHVGERRVADDRPRIHRVGEPLHHRPVAVDHGHVVRLIGELTSDAGADLSGTAYDDLHGPFSLPGLPLFPPVSASPSAVRSPCSRSSIPSERSLRWSAERSMPTNCAVREMLPPKRSTCAFR